MHDSNTNYQMFMQFVFLNDQTPSALINQTQAVNSAWRAAPARRFCEDGAALTKPHQYPVPALRLGAAELSVTLWSFFLNPVSSVSCGKREEQMQQHGRSWQRIRAPGWSIPGKPRRICARVFTEGRERGRQKGLGKGRRLF